MHFFLRKVRLLVFLTRRLPRLGWSQWMRGLRDRETAYVAMDLARILPPVVSTIIDVGGHSGQVSEALDFLYRPQRVWVVEPNPALGPNLDARFRDRPQFVVIKCCLGEANGEVSFNVYDFDAASSIYACKVGHLASLGISEQSRSVKVEMKTLLELIPVDVATIDLLKLDCQGAELSVLKGAGNRIRDIRWVYCEVSIDPIYEGAPLFGEVHAFLREAGFELRHMDGFSGAGRSIQWADALYANVRLTEL